MRGYSLGLHMAFWFFNHVPIFNIHSLPWNTGDISLCNRSATPPRSDYNTRVPIHQSYTYILNSKRHFLDFMRMVVDFRFIDRQLLAAVLPISKNFTTITILLFRGCDKALLSMFGGPGYRRLWLLDGHFSHPALLRNVISLYVLCFTYLNTSDGFPDSHMPTPCCS